MRVIQFVFTIAVILVFSACRNSERIEPNITRVQQTKEQFRPHFHFTPEEKWMNDPNGLVYHNEYYHLFYQYYPDSTVWGPMHWGHARSKDLLKWEHLPIALYPDSLGYIFSGSAVVDKKNTAGFGKDAMVAIYTYHDPVGEKAGAIDFQTQGIAYSNDDGMTWTKYSGNPVIPNPGIRDFRDPKVFWNDEKGIWQMALVAGDHVIFYESSDLKSWIKLSEFRFEDDEDLGVWECPDLFKLPVEGSFEEKWVLIISHGTGAPNGGSGTRYFIGEFDGTTFITEQTASKWIDYGTDNYAGVTYNDAPANNRIFIGWMSNWAYAIYTPTKRWRSAMTLPRALTLHKEGNAYYLKSKVIDGYKVFLESIASEGETGDFESEFLQRSHMSFQVSFDSDLKLEIGNQFKERFTFGYLKDKGIFYTNRSRSGIVDFNESFTNPSPQLMKIGDRNTLNIELFIDSSSIEIFIDEGRYVMTNQVFPENPYTTLRVLSQNTAISGFKAERIESTTK
ncbi:MAG: glycoside hydrolase family 32 protein [Bacteroidia bacterium]|nr:glycoside hydrolase family 32 protein [Bacteroidia bacterium]